MPRTLSRWRRYVPTAMPHAPTLQHPQRCRLRFRWHDLYHARRIPRSTPTSYCPSAQRHLRYVYLLLRTRTAHFKHTSVERRSLRLFLRHLSRSRRLRRRATRRYRYANRRRFKSLLAIMRQCLCRKFEPLHRTSCLPRWH